MAELSPEEENQRRDGDERLRREKERLYQTHGENLDRWVTDPNIRRVMYGVRDSLRRRFPRARILDEKVRSNRDQYAAEATAYDDEESFNMLNPQSWRNLFNRYRGNVSALRSENSRGRLERREAADRYYAQGTLQEVADKAERVANMRRKARLDLSLDHLYDSGRLDGILNPPRDNVDSLPLAIRPQQAQNVQQILDQVRENTGNLGTDLEQLQIPQQVVNQAQNVQQSIERIPVPPQIINETQVLTQAIEQVNIPRDLHQNLRNAIRNVRQAPNSLQAYQALRNLREIIHQNEQLDQFEPQVEALKNTILTNNNLQIPGGLAAQANNLAQSFQLAQDLAQVQMPNNTLTNAQNNLEAILNHTRNPAEAYQELQNLRNTLQQVQLPQQIEQQIQNLEQTLGEVQLPNQATQEGQGLLQDFHNLHVFPAFSNRITTFLHQMQHAHVSPQLYAAAQTLLQGFQANQAQIPVPVLQEANNLLPDLQGDIFQMDLERVFNFLLANQNQFPQQFSQQVQDIIQEITQIYLDPQIAQQANNFLNNIPPQGVSFQTLQQIAVFLQNLNQAQLPQGITNQIPGLLGDIQTTLPTAEAESDFNNLSNLLQQGTLSLQEYNQAMGYLQNLRQNPISPQIRTRLVNISQILETASQQVTQQASDQTRNLLQIFRQAQMGGQTLGQAENFLLNIAQAQNFEQAFTAFSQMEDLLGENVDQTTLQQIQNMRRDLQQQLRQEQNPGQFNNDLQNLEQNFADTQLAQNISQQVQDSLQRIREAENAQAAFAEIESLEQLFQQTPHLNQFVPQLQTLRDNLQQVEIPQAVIAQAQGLQQAIQGAAHLNPFVAPINNLVNNLQNRQNLGQAMQDARNLSQNLQDSRISENLSQQVRNLQQAMQNPQHLHQVLQQAQNLQQIINQNQFLQNNPALQGHFQNIINNLNQLQTPQQAYIDGVNAIRGVIETRIGGSLDHLTTDPEQRALAIEIETRMIEALNGVDFNNVDAVRNALNGVRDDILNNLQGFPEAMQAKETDAQKNIREQMESIMTMNDELIKLYVRRNTVMNSIMTIPPNTNDRNQINSRTRLDNENRKIIEKIIENEQKFRRSASNLVNSGQGLSNIPLPQTLMDLSVGSSGTLYTPAEATQIYTPAEGTLEHFLINRFDVAAQNNLRGEIENSYLSTSVTVTPRELLLLMKEQNFRNLGVAEPETVARLAYMSANLDIIDAQDQAYIGAANREVAESLTGFWARFRRNLTRERRDFRTIVDTIARTKQYKQLRRLSPYATLRDLRALDLDTAHLPVLWRQLMQLLQGYNEKGRRFEVDDTAGLPLENLINNLKLLYLEDRSRGFMDNLVNIKPNMTPEQSKLAYLQEMNGQEVEFNKEVAEEFKEKNWISELFGMRNKLKNQIKEMRTEGKGDTEIAEALAKEHGTFVNPENIQNLLKVGITAKMASTISEKGKKLGKKFATRISTKAGWQKTGRNAKFIGKWGTVPLWGPYFWLPYKGWQKVVKPVLKKTFNIVTWPFKTADRILRGAGQIITGPPPKPAT